MTIQTFLCFSCGNKQQQQKLLENSEQEAFIWNVLLNLSSYLNQITVKYLQLRSWLTILSNWSFTIANNRHNRRNFSVSGDSNLTSHASAMIIVISPYRTFFAFGLNLSYRNMYYCFHSTIDNYLSKWIDLLSHIFYQQ